MPVLSMESLAEKAIRERFPHLRQLSRGTDQTALEAKTALADMTQAMIDPVTRLARREVFFQELHRAILIAIPELERDGFNPITQDLRILVGDLAALAMHNARSPQHGDRVLRRTAIAMLREFPGQIAARIGGDEFALISHLGTAQTSDSIEVIFANVARYPFNRIDMEQSGFADVRHFLALQKLPKQRRIKFLANLMVDIAMNRAQVMKYWRSTQILAGIWKNETLFRKIAPFFTKGAGNISAEEVERFAQLSGKQLAEAAMLYALTKKAGQMTTPYERAVFEVAESIFVTSS